MCPKVSHNQLLLWEKHEWGEPGDKQDLRLNSCHMRTVTWLLNTKCFYFCFSSFVLFLFLKQRKFFLSFYS